MSYICIPLAIQTYTKHRTNEEMRRTNQANMIARVYGTSPHILTVKVCAQGEFQEKIKMINNTANHYTLQLPIQHELDELTHDLAGRGTF